MNGELHVIPPSSNWYLPSVSHTSRDGKYFVYGANCNIVLLNKPDKECKFTLLTGHTQRVNSVRFSEIERENNLLISCAQDKTVRVWNIETKQNIITHTKHENIPICVTNSSYSPSTILSVDEDGLIIIWKLPNISQIPLTTDQIQNDIGHFSKLSTSSFNIKSKVNIIKCTTLENNVAIGYQTGVILLVNYKTSTITHRLIGHNDYICALSFGPINIEEKKEELNTDNEENNIKNSKYFMVSGSKDKSIRFWNLETGRSIQTIQLPSETGAGKSRRQTDSRQRFWCSVSWNPFNPLEVIVSSHSGDIFKSQLKYLPKKQNKKEEKLNNSDLIQLFYSSSEEDFDNNLFKWSIERFKSGNKGKQHSRAVFNISFLNCNEFITISMDRQIGFWNIKNKQLRQMIHCPGGHVYGLDTSPLQPACIALGVGDQSILLWNPPKYKKDSSLQGDLYNIKSIWRGIQSKVTAIKWHPIKDVSIKKNLDFSSIIPNFHRILILFHHVLH